MASENLLVLKNAAIISYLAFQVKGVVRKFLKIFSLRSNARFSRTFIIEVSSRLTNAQAIPVKTPCFFHQKTEPTR
jgi:hypothetical protein